MRWKLRKDKRIHLITWHQLTPSWWNDHPIEVISSLKKVTKSNNFIFSWDNINYFNDAIEDKIILENKIGKFETLNDLWVKTNGEYGVKNDSHWSYDYNIKFANYINKKFNERN